jgi:hypothetical protein
MEFGLWNFESIKSSLLEIKSKGSNMLEITVGNPRDFKISILLFYILNDKECRTTQSNFLTHMDNSVQTFSTEL